MRVYYKHPDRLAENCRVVFQELSNLALCGKNYCRLRALIRRPRGSGSGSICLEFVMHEKIKGHRVQPRRMFLNPFRFRNMAKLRPFKFAYQCSPKLVRGTLS